MTITSGQQYARSLPSQRERLPERGLLILMRGGVMLKAAVLFLVVGLMAALLGFTSIAGASFAIAKVFAGIFLFMFLMVMGLALFAIRAV
jgi:uncharacterized membrane protein YtjA (UPF0391 family)